jgi:hypothetical protein
VAFFDAGVHRQRPWTESAEFTALSTTVVGHDQLVPDFSGVRTLADVIWNTTKQLAAKSAETNTNTTSRFMARKDARSRRAQRDSVRSVRLELCPCRLR